MHSIAATSDENTAIAEGVQRPLRDFLSRPAELSTVTLHFGPANAERADVVILGSAQPDHVKITPSLDGGLRIAIISAQTTATAITDPQRQNELLRQATQVLAAERDALDAGSRDNQLRHQRTLDQIRRYAINRHLDSEICREGLNKFLSHFDMHEYRPRIKVAFTITGSYEVDADTMRNAEYDARNHLSVDFSDIDDYVDDSSDYSVTVAEADEVTED